jgi:O-methyltransferase
MITKLISRVYHKVRLTLRSKSKRFAGEWHNDDVKRFTKLVENVPGEFAEIGVWRGDTSRKLIPIAAAQKKQVHLIDSFSGMAEPGRFDSGVHPTGEFDVGGVAGFQAIMRRHGFANDRYHTWQGYIPHCFKNIPSDLRFSFVILDVDNDEPTRDALEYIWPRMNAGGILALDDFYPGAEVDSTKAIKEFLRDQSDYYFIDFFNYQLFLRKSG